jgi:hypothetical protein
MSQEDNQDDQLLLILLAFGFVKETALKIIKLANKDETVKEIILNNDAEALAENEKAKKIIKKEPARVSGVTQILIDAGFTLTIAATVAQAFSEDDTIPELIEDDKRPLIFMTQRDSKVDDLICLPLEGTVWDIDDPQRPQIPATTHPNCRCFWIDPVTGTSLGQF